MILLPHFDIPSAFRLGKTAQEFPFQGPVFFGLPHHFTAKVVKQLSKFPSPGGCGFEFHWYHNFSEGLYKIVLEILASPGYPSFAGIS